MNEDAEVVGACALRFDGYKYERDHPGDYPNGLPNALYANRFDQSFEPYPDLNENLSVFFLLQRTIKWTGHLDFRARLVYVQLFLHVHDTEVPVTYAYPQEGHIARYGEREMLQAKALARRLQPHLELAISRYSETAP